MNLRKSLTSFRFAFNGLHLLLKSENNFQIHMLATLAAIALGVFVKLSVVEWTILCLQIALVLAAEAFNTSLEKLCDFIEPTHRPAIGIIKDIAAAGVLLVALSAVVVGSILFIPKLLRYL